MSAIKNRYDFVFLFDVCNGNPNGDPDAGNMPRTDPETGHGIVTDVCIKRKIRNYAEIAKEGEPGYGIYVREGSILNDAHRLAYEAVRPDDKKVTTDKKLNPRDDAEATRLRQFMCDNFFDVRTFGAVMSTGVNCGQVRGPVQLAFSRSIEPIVPQEISITRMARTSAEEKTATADGSDGRTENRTMGRKSIVPYGLYRVHGFVSANLAARTGFGDGDLALLWQALSEMFEQDRSAARGEMSAHKLVVFRHASALGNAHAADLFERVVVTRQPGMDPDAPARDYRDYAVTVDNANLPDGVEVLEML
jgi:CRISPR-associated protein Csd2